MSTTEDDAGGDEGLLSGQMSGEFSQPDKAATSRVKAAQDPSGRICKKVETHCPGEHQLCQACLGLSAPHALLTVEVLLLPTLDGRALL